jgi:hypothetical protein
MLIQLQYYHRNHSFKAIKSLLKSESACIYNFMRIECYISSYENTNLTILLHAIGDRQKVSHVNQLLALNYI